MESFFVLLGLAALSALVLGPVGFFMAVGARNRLADMEARLLDAERRLAAIAPASAAPPQAPGEAPQPSVQPQEDIAPPAAQAARPPEAEPDREAARTAAQEPLQEPLQEPAREPAPPRRSLEEALGARWSVIVGGVALSLGALLLVRYSIEQGFFGPGMRVAMGFALAVALISGGEIMRRRERRAGAQEPRQETGEADGRPDIPAILTAAGTVAVFGSIYAGHALYGFFGPGLAFAALAAAGIACMFASALHGPALAGLGLVGALAAPLLVSSSDPTPWPVAALAAVVSACAYWLALARRWLWLAASAAIGGGLWSLAFLEGVAGAPERFAAGAFAHLLAQTALALAVFAAPLRALPEARARPDPHAALAAAGYAALAAMTLHAALDAGAYGALWLLVAAAAVAIPAAAGFLIAAAAPALAIAGLLSLAALRIWPDPAYAIGQHWSPPLAADEWPFAADPHLYAAFAAGAAALAALAGGWRLALARALPLVSAAIYAGAAILTPLALLSIAFVRLTDRSISLPFATLAALLALAFAFAAARFRTMEAREAGDSAPLARFAAGAFASGAIGALALGFVFALQGETLTVALAGAALGAAAVATRLDLPALRWCVAGLGLLVAARLALDPRLVSEAGPWPIVNWILFAYGAPAACFAAAAWIMSRNEEDDLPLRIAQSLAIIFAAFLTFFEIRHFINDGDAFARGTSLAEQGLFATSALAFSIGLARLGGGRSALFRFAALAAALIALGVIVAGLGIIANPLFTGDSIEGGKFINGLMLGYALPALLALALARASRRLRPRWFVLSATSVAMALAFVYVSLQTRRIFNDATIGLREPTSQAEWYAYSAIWLALGAALLAWGLIRGSKEARIGSGLLICASVVKVFLFDLAGLEGVLRALSFIGLGGALIAIGLVYQKFVFARPRAPNPT